MTKLTERKPRLLFETEATARYHRGRARYAGIHVGIAAQRNAGALRDFLGGCV